MKEALQIAASITNPAYRVQALCALLPNLARPQRGIVFFSALRVAWTIQNPVDRSRALGALIPAAFAPARRWLTWGGIKGAASGADKKVRRNALIEFVQDLPDDIRPDVFGIVLRGIRKFWQPEDLSKVLEDLTSYVPASWSGQFAALIEDTANTVGSARERSVKSPVNQYSNWIAPLPELQRARALLAALANDRPRMAGWLLAASAMNAEPARKATFVLEAVAEARRVVVPVERAALERFLATISPEPLRQQIFSESLNITRQVRDPLEHANGIVELIPIAPPALKYTLVNEAMVAALRSTWTEGDVMKELIPLIRDAESDELDSILSQMIMTLGHMERGMALRGIPSLAPLLAKYPQEVLAECSDAMRDVTRWWP
jgi:hypothetical protein